RAIVGVNKYVTESADDSIPTLKIEMEIEQAQIERIKELRGGRDQAAAAAALATVERALGDESLNVMPAIIDAVKAHVTLGEICDLFRTTFGEHRDPAYL